MTCNGISEVPNFKTDVGEEEKETNDSVAFPKLRQLKLGSNLLTSHEDILGISRLPWFVPSFSRSLLTHENYSCFSLRVLNLDGNKLTSLPVFHPDDFPQLVELSLTDNFLITNDSIVGLVKLTALQKVILYNNPIVKDTGNQSLRDKCVEV